MRNFPAQYNLKPEDVMYFCHIPKTAGMTFRTIVEDYFSCKDVCPATLNAHIAKFSQEQLETYRLFRGHLVFVDLPGMLPQRNFVNVTMLRDPIARVISHYEYIRRTPGDPHHEAVMSMTLEEFSQKLTVGKVGKNIQTFYIAKTQQFHLEKLSPQEVLEIAKEGIDRYAFAGILERFQDSLFLLSYIFGWKPILNQRKENASAKQTTYNGLPQSTIDCIRENSLLDIELYEYAEEIFNQRFDQMCADLKKKYGQEKYGDRSDAHTPEVLQSWLEKHYEQRYAEQQLPETDSFDYSFCDPLWGAGWQRRECPPDAPAYRWTGPGTVSTLDLPVKANEDLLLEFRLICNTATAPDILESLTVKVNDQAISYRSLYADETMKLCRGWVPRSHVAVDRPFQQITFTVDRVTTLTAVDPRNPDKRKVGVALNLIQLFPAAQIGEKSAIHWPFEESQPWTDAIDFMRNHLRPDERLVAPDAVFQSKFFCEVYDYETAIDKGIDFEWVLLNKGMAQHIFSMTLKAMQRGLKPVYANDVFVVFSSRSDLPSLSYSSHHVKALYLDRLKIYAKQTLRDLYVRYWGKSSS
ncbi:sulfotransferase family 2 domain-containing protein [Microcoleus sp. FACHB-1515]|uniref:sulfotransferase family 2 domain-containing protein n=1 Tax=Cyanophyceae TaxID=3028117 RepID=UPI001687CCAB|nr:sulfotransferase family 2 domain-containing protein [Microcoleus sp. FACHB-1515]MBD2088484.1 sulfotransferase family 2 domain-containing protein [Microcoleus sp. FACHB-1515]